MGGGEGTWRKGRGRGLGRGAQMSEQIHRPRLSDGSEAAGHVLRSGILTDFVMAASGSGRNPPRPAHPLQGPAPRGAHKSLLGTPPPSCSQTCGPPLASHSRGEPVHLHGLGSCVQSVSAAQISLPDCGLHGQPQPPLRCPGEG